VVFHLQNKSQGGVNFDHNKKVDYWKGLFKKGTGNAMSIGAQYSCLSMILPMQDKVTVSDGDDINTLTLSKNKVKSSISTLIAITTMELLHLALQQKLKKSIQFCPPIQFVHDFPATSETIAPVGA
jgi:hypothetical protein